MKKLFLLVGLLHFVGCGGSGTCGDGVVDPGEQCDTGGDSQYCHSCIALIPPRTTVKWIFDAAATPDFSEDSCIDTGTLMVQVDLVGPTTETMTANCPDHQAVWTDLPVGTYTATVTPLDINGSSLVTQPVTMQVTTASTDTEHDIDIPPDAWKGPYTGTFFFTLHWGGADCATASPPVSTQTVTLSVDGVPVTQHTTVGEKLDGSDSVTCVPPSIAMPITALMVPFGFATIEVVGRDSGGTTAFHSSFDTFVGAGPSNPTIDYDVQTVYDAGPPDAAPPDA